MKRLSRVEGALFLVDAAACLALGALPSGDEISDGPSRYRVCYASVSRKEFQQREI